MTFMSEPNRDAYSVSPDQVATGPLVGFFDSWEASVDAQMRASSQFGIEYFMQELDWQQTRAMLDAGVVDPPQLILGLEDRQPGEGPVSVAQLLRRDSGYYEDFIPERSSAYLDVARRYSGQEIGDEFEERLQAYDARVSQIRRDRPDLALLSSREMFDRVRQDAQASETRMETDRRTWGGAFGSFFGGALASLHPGTDPLNFYSMGLGGAGRTAVQRIGVQMGAQGVVETINQVTGVQEERRLLGLSSGLADAAMRVGATALGAGAIQGLGEAAGAVARRWFRDIPTDPAPPPPAAVRGPEALPTPPPVAELRQEAQALLAAQDGRSYFDTLIERTPLSGLRLSAPRAAADLIGMTQRLEDWGAPAPAAIAARTSSVTFPNAPRTAPVDLRPAVDNNRLYQVARDEDPQAFKLYDDLTERRSTYRRWIEELAVGRDKDISVTLERMQQRLHTLEARHKTTQGKTNKLRIRQEIAQVKADREQLIAASRTRETPDIARVRADLVKTDEKMRDVAPLIGRAYARARGRWGETAEDLDAVWSAYREGRGKPDAAASSIPDYDTAMMTLQDRAPVLQRANTVPEQATPALTAKAIIAENAKVLDDALDAYRAEIKRLVSVGDDGRLVVQGREYEFDIDKDTMFVPQEDGTGGREVTIREFLGDLRRAEDELEGVSTCSLRS